MRAARLSHIAVALVLLLPPIVALGQEAGRVASGAGIRPLGAIPVIRMVDIAPTIAALLGVELPDADGNPIRGILDAAGMRATSP